MWAFAVFVKVQFSIKSLLYYYYLKSSIKPRGAYLFFVVLEGELDREEDLIERELISNSR